MDGLLPDPWYHSPLKLTLAIIGGIIGALAIIFTTYLIFFLWQFKFGDAETLQQLNTSYREKRFTETQPGSGEALERVDTINEFIRPHDATKGNLDAPLTVVAFIDFGCPFSQEGYPLFESIIRKYDPALRVVFKHLPLSALHPQAMPAAVAASCAGYQGKFWEYYTLLFNEKRFDQNALDEFATRLNLDVNAFTSCMKKEMPRKNIEQDMLDAVTVGVRGTPTYVVNGEVIEGVVSETEWDQVILRALKK